MTSGLAGRSLLRASKAGAQKEPRMKSRQYVLRRVPRKMWPQDTGKPPVDISSLEQRTVITAVPSLSNHRLKDNRTTRQQRGTSLKCGRKVCYCDFRKTSNLNRTA